MARPDAAFRRGRALRLRVDGMSYEGISQDMQANVAGVGAAYTARKAADDVTEALREAQALLAGADSTESKDLARSLDLERLDAWAREAQQILKDSVDDGSRLDALRAIDRLLRIEARRDSLLALSAEAAVPPSPEADEVDELRARREEKIQARAARQS